jgi:hypothetical protein
VLGGAFLADGRASAAELFLALALANLLLLVAAWKRSSAITDEASRAAATTDPAPDAPSSGARDAHQPGGEAAPDAPQATGELEISRAKGGGDLLRAYHVLVDGKDLGKIRRGQSRCFALPAGAHQVHLELDSQRSRSITLEITPDRKQRLSCRSNFARGTAPTGEWIALEQGES